MISWVGVLLEDAISRWGWPDREAAGRREQVQFEAAELFAQGVTPPQVARVASRPVV